jgi:GGDEF domain-containing protein
MKSPLEVVYDISKNSIQNQLRDISKKYPITNKKIKGDLDEIINNFWINSALFFSFFVQKIWSHLNKVNSEEVHSLLDKSKLNQSIPDTSATVWLRFRILRSLKEFIKSKPKLEDEMGLKEKEEKSLKEQWSEYQRSIVNFFAKVYALIHTASAYDRRFIGNTGVKDLYIHNKSFVLDKIFTIITDEQEKNYNFTQFCYHLSCYGIIIADLNAFKSINDLWSYKTGDDYLHLLVDLLLNNEAIKNFAHEKDLELDAFSRGGDEFGYFVYYKKENLTEEMLLQLEEIIRQEVEKLNVESIFSFRDVKVQKKCLQSGIQIPIDYKFPPTVATGSYTMLKTIYGLSEKTDEFVFSGEQHSEEEFFGIFATRIINYFERLAVDKMHKNKAAYKKALSADHTNIYNLCTLNSILRNDENRRLEEEKRILSAKVNQLLSSVRVYERFIDFINQTHPDWLGEQQHLFQAHLATTEHDDKALVLDAKQKLAQHGLILSLEEISEIEM